MYVVVQVSRCRRARDDVVAEACLNVGTRTRNKKWWKNLVKKIFEANRLTNRRTGSVAGNSGGDSGGPDLAPEILAGNLFRRIQNRNQFRRKSEQEIVDLS